MTTESHILAEDGTPLITLIEENPGAYVHPRVTAHILDESSTPWDAKTLQEDCVNGIFATFTNGIADLLRRERLPWPSTPRQEAMTSVPALGALHTYVRQKPIRGTGHATGWDAWHHSIL